MTLFCYFIAIFAVGVIALMLADKGEKAIVTFAAMFITSMFYWSAVVTVHFIVKWW